MPICPPSVLTTPHHPLHTASPRLHPPTYNQQVPVSRTEASRAHMASSRDAGKLSLPLLLPSPSCFASFPSYCHKSWCEVHDHNVSHARLASTTFPCTCVTERPAFPAVDPPAPCLPPHPPPINTHTSSPSPSPTNSYAPNQAGRHLQDWRVRKTAPPVLYAANQG